MEVEVFKTYAKNCHILTKNRNFYILDPKVPVESSSTISGTTTFASAIRPAIKKTINISSFFFFFLLKQS
jgi:hypothetical protein